MFGQSARLSLCIWCWWVHLGIGGLASAPGALQYASQRFQSPLLLPLQLDLLRRVRRIDLFRAAADDYLLPTFAALSPLGAEPSLALFLALAFQGTLDLLALPAIASLGIYRRLIRWAPCCGLPGKSALTGLTRSAP